MLSCVTYGKLLGCNLHTFLLLASSCAFCRGRARSWGVVPCVTHGRQSGCVACLIFFLSSFPAAHTRTNCCIDEAQS